MIDSVLQHSEDQVYFLLICLQATILRKSNSFIIVFKDKVSDFIVKHLFSAQKVDEKIA